MDLFSHPLGSAEFRQGLRQWMVPSCSKRVRTTGLLMDSSGRGWEHFGVTPPPDGDIRYCSVNEGQQCVIDQIAAEEKHVLWTFVGDIVHLIHEMGSSFLL